MLTGPQIQLHRGTTVSAGLAPMLLSTEQVCSSAIVPMPDIKGIFSTKEKALLMLDHIIACLERDKGERETVEILKETKANFNSQGILFTTERNPETQAKNLRLENPCAVQLTLGLETKRVDNIALKLNSNDIERCWDNKSQPYVLISLASIFLKEGVYIHDFLNGEQKLSVISCATSEFINTCQIVKEKIFTTRKDKDIEHLLNKLLLGARKSLAALVYMEYIGYVPMLEFLFRQGFTKENVQKILSSVTALNDCNLLGSFNDLANLMNNVSSRGEVDEKKLKYRIVQFEIYHGRTQLKQADNTTSTTLKAFLVAHPKYNKETGEVEATDLEVINWLYHQLVESISVKELEM